MGIEERVSRTRLTIIREETYVAKMERKTKGIYVVAIVETKKSLENGT